MLRQKNAISQPRNAGELTEPGSGRISARAALAQTRTGSFTLSTEQATRSAGRARMSPPTTSAAFCRRMRPWPRPTVRADISLMGACLVAHAPAGSLMRVDRPFARFGSPMPWPPTQSTACRSRATKAVPAWRPLQRRLGSSWMRQHWRRCPHTFPSTCRRMRGPSSCVCGRAR